MIDTRQARERVVLVGVQLADGDDTEASLYELEQLAKTAGAEAVGRIIQNREKPHPATYLGKGKLDEVKELVWETGATGILCDDELSPAQLSGIQQALDVKVMDRTLLILDIFAARARTKEGKIQVELAQLKYRASRLVGLRDSLSRLGGGIGTRGPGETKLETEECRQRYGMSPTQLFASMGMYDFGGGGFHCVWFDEKDMEIYQKQGLSAVTNPGSNSKLASGIAPVNEFVKRGINVAIGTDGPASNNCLDMFKEMFLVSSLAKLRDMDAAVMDANEVLYMATAGGAKAMGLPNCDRLAVGKKADLIMIDLMQPNMQPVINITKNLVYSGSKQNVKMTLPRFTEEPMRLWQE